MRKNLVGILALIALVSVIVISYEFISNEVHIDKMEENEYRAEERPKQDLSEEEMQVNQRHMDRYGRSGPKLKSTTANSSYANGKVQGTWDQVRILGASRYSYGFRVDGSVYDQEHDVIYPITYAGHIWKINRDEADYTKTRWELINHKYNFKTSYIEGLNKADGSFRMVRSSGTGMQYSDDEGRNWTNVAGIQFVEGSNEGAVVKANGSNRVFVAGKPNSGSINVYVSTNNGESYTALSPSFSTSSYTVKITKPHNSESVFIMALNKSTSLMSVYECKPTDSDFSLVNTSTTTFVGMDRVFGTFYNNNYHFYVASKNTHIYYTGDKGTTWQLKNSTNNSDGDTNPRTVHPTKPNVIFKGYLDLNMSTDYGVSFTNFSHWLGWDLHELKMYQKKDGSYFQFVGMDFGCFMSYTPETIAEYFQLNNTAPTQMCYDADHCQLYYSSFTANQDRGTVGYISSSNESYTTDVKTTDGLRVTVGTNEQSVWTWMYYGSIFHQSNFAVKSSGLAQLNFTGNWWAAPMIPSPNAKEDAVYIAAGQRLTKFTYNPANNSIIKTQHYFDFGSETGSEITGFGYSPLNTGRWYVSVKTGDFYYSEDGGQSFNKSSYTGLFPRANDQSYNYHKNQHVIKASNLDEKKVYYAGVGNLFMISNDGGKTFTNHSSGLDIYRIRDFDFTPDEKFIFAACAGGGIWVYSVDDDRWYEMNDEVVPNVDFTDVEYIVRENTVNFGTYGNGILKLKLEVATPAVVYPDRLSAEIVNGNQVKLSWNDNSENEIAFIIQRAKDGGDFVQIANVSAGQTSYTDTQLLAGGDYVYRVKAINSTQSSQYSNYALASVPAEGVVSKANWTLVSVDSEEANYEATKAFDGNENTMWHTQWTVTPKPDYPHTLVIDMHNTLTLQGFGYLPRQDGQWNGTIKGYEFYVSTDNANWEKVASGTWAQTKINKEVYFSSPVDARFIKLVGLSEVTGSVYASCAELSVYTQIQTQQAPAAPQFVQGGRLSDTAIELIWMDKSTDEDGFIVEQLIDGNFSPIYTSGQDVTTYTLSNTSKSASYSFRVASFNSDGNSEYSDVLTLNAVGVPVGVDDELTSQQDVVVYPNPFTDELKINTGTAGLYSNWQIFDMSGKLMMNGVFPQYSANETINVQNLKSGVYLIRLTGTEGSVSKSIMKK